MHPCSNVDESEIRKFDRVASAWWDPSGEMRSLHAVNPLRTRFIFERNRIRSPRILDVGCGGGILSLALARAGARVTGIDLSRASLDAARQQAGAQELNVDFRCSDVQQVAADEPAQYDVVTCMEMLEHVPDPAQVITACARTLKPGGWAFFSTINRTPKAYLCAIVGAEYVLHLLPRGSHSYRRLIRPQEMREWAGLGDLQYHDSASILYNPFTRSFRLADHREDINYLASFIKIA